MKTKKAKLGHHIIRIPEQVWKEAEAFYRDNESKLKGRYGIQSTEAFVWRATLEYIQRLRKEGLRL